MTAGSPPRLTGFSIATFVIVGPDSASVQLLQAALRFVFKLIISASVVGSSERALLGSFMRGGLS